MENEDLFVTVQMISELIADLTKQYIRKDILIYKKLKWTPLFEYYTKINVNNLFFNIENITFIKKLNNF